jgi:hypothetical protein
MGASANGSLAKIMFRRLLCASTGCLAFVISAPNGGAAIRLDLHEARILVEHTPVFLSAITRGECPQTSDAAINGNVATVVIRGGCKRFDWIADLYVDLTQGVITTDNGASGPKNIETPMLVAIRNELFAQRARFLLTSQEALCVVRTIRTLNIGTSCHRLNMERNDENAFTVFVEETCKSGSESSGVFVRIDRCTGAVTNEQTGQNYKSNAVELLRQTLQTVHSPERLGLADAKHLAESEEVITELVREGWLKDSKCLQVRIDPFNNADEMWFQVEGGCAKGVKLARISINLLTASVRVLEPNVVLESVPLRRLEESVLAKVRSRIAAATDTIRRKCR